MSARKALRQQQPSNGSTPVPEVRKSPVMKLFHFTISPLLLMVVTINMALAIYYICSDCKGSYSEFGRRLIDNPQRVFNDLWLRTPLFSPFALKVLLGYAVYALILQRILPGKPFTGPVTQNGNIPRYKDNGFLQFLVTMATLWGLQYYLVQNNMSLSIIYDRFGEIQVSLNLFALVICSLLYLKGLFVPSSTDCGSSGHVVFDFYWGTELYPRVLGWDVKTFTNCRFGMMVWPIMVCIYSIKSYELHGFVDSMFASAVVQMVYLTKFYWWEAGYMNTMDIIVDRAGYYICWGCLVWVPTFYTSPGMYLVTHPVRLGSTLTAAFILAGVLCVIVNYWADYQKQYVRQMKGDCNIWGRKAKVIRAQFKTKSGESHKSLLLVSGFWAMSRHFHYLPEIGLAFFWCVPALGGYLFPYSYSIFLTILLTHRTYRDDERCLEKYGEYWKQYIKLVPQRMIPYIY